MKGDFSRETFEPDNHYRRVLMQQGRVEIDADGNEQIAIDHHLAATTTYDVIGRTGVPLTILPDGTPAGGFAMGLNADGSDLTISKGRIYVDGLLVENDTATATLLQQPDYPIPLPASLTSLNLSARGVYVVYLDIWERLITALDDPLLRESALGGPDTSVRSKLVWQVKLAFVQPPGGVPPTCASVGEPWLPPAPQGLLAAGTNASPVDPLPCILPPETGFRRLENQLYRVEVHTPGGFGVATFKWSREDGSIVAGVVQSDPNSPTTVQGPTFSVAVAGRDASLEFTAGDWVELSDDRSELVDGHGELLQLQTTPTNGTLTTTSAAARPVDLGLHPKLRLWNQAGVDLSAGIPILNSDPVLLEDGVQVQFSDGHFNLGDYWLIPARTKTSVQQGNIEWPVDAANTPVFLPPKGIEHHFAKVALVGFDGTRFQPIDGGVPDCRVPFPPLTELEPAESTTGPCTIVVKPGTGWEAPIVEMFAKQPAADAEICFPVGTFPTNGLLIQTQGNVKVSGAGRGTRVIASGTESAIRFEGCASAEVHDLFAETSSVNAPSDKGGRHINGTLGFHNCADVVIQNVALRCGSGIVRGAACIGVTNDITDVNAATGVGTVIIRDSLLRAGQMQTGIQLVHVKRATVENNQIEALGGGRFATLTDLLQDSRFLALARRALVSGASLTPPPVGPAAPDPTSPPGPPSGRRRRGPTPSPESAPLQPPGNVTVRVGNQTLSFQSHPGLQATWQTFLDQNAPKEFATPRDALNFVKSAATRIVSDPTARAQLAGFSDVVNTLAQQSRLLPAARGIVITGRASRHVDIHNNDITGFLQGIGCAVSHREPTAGAPDRMQTVSISGNRIDIGLNLLARGTARLGIFVGNVDSLEIDNNRAILTVDRGATGLPSDGIRVWGYLGKKVEVLNNHLTGFTGAGIKVVALAGVGKVITEPQKPSVDTRPGNLWLIANNALEFIHTPIDAPACMQSGNII
jgi:hypothetical protein